MFSNKTAGSFPSPETNPQGKCVCLCVCVCVSVWVHVGSGRFVQSSWSLSWCRVHQDVVPPCTAHPDTNGSQHTHKHTHQDSRKHPHESVRTHAHTHPPTRTHTLVKSPSSADFSKIQASIIHQHFCLRHFCIT